MDHRAASKHHIGNLIPEAGRGRARVGPWAGAGLLAGGCLGCGYGFLAGLMGGFGVAAYGAVFGGTIGLIAGPLIGFPIGLAHVMLRRTAIPVPVIAVAVTEFILLPPQFLAAGARWQPGAAVFIYIPSVLGIGTAAVLGFLLPPAKRPLRRRGKPAPGLPRSRGSTELFGRTGLRLRAYRPWRYRRSRAHFLSAASTKHEVIRHGHQPGKRRHVHDVRADRKCRAAVLAAVAAGRAELGPGE